MAEEPPSLDDIMEVLLQTYYAVYPALMVDTSEAVAAVKQRFGYGEAGVETVFKKAQDEGFLSQSGGAIEITAKGMTWLTQRLVGKAVKQINDLNQQLALVAGELAMARADAENNVAAVAKDTEATIRQVAAEQDGRLSAQIADQKRSFYTTLIPIFTLFVAVVAIIVTVAQVGSKVVSEGNPQMTWDQTSSVMLPTAGTVLGMVLIVWLVIWATTHTWR
jgi:hypothetical protein